MNNNTTIAVIMAGGKGTRIADVDPTLPKPMLPILGKPILAHQIECLRTQGFTEIVMIIGHLSDKIVQYFGNGKEFGVNIKYITENQPLGTAGGLWYLKGHITEDFILINGDIIFYVDLKRLLEYHKSKGVVATILTHPNDHPFDSGVIQTDDNNYVTKWIIKEENHGWLKNSVNAGIHVFSPDILKYFDMPKKTDLDRDILKMLISEKELCAYNSPEYCKDMGTLKRLREVESDIVLGKVLSKCLLKKQRAVFLDRDGTMCKYKGFIKDIDDFELIFGVADAVKAINKSGMLAVCITNQPVIARGDVTWEQLSEIHNKMETLLGEQGAYLDGIYVCPHHPDKGFEGERPEYKITCKCRKPKPGLFFDAAKDLNIDLSQSYMIGDSDIDIEAGNNAGCTSIMCNDDYSLYECVKDILDQIYNNNEVTV